MYKEGGGADLLLTTHSRRTSPLLLELPQSRRKKLVCIKGPNSQHHHIGKKLSTRLCADNHIQITVWEFPAPFACVPLAWSSQDASFFSEHHIHTAPGTLVSSIPLLIQVSPALLLFPLLQFNTAWGSCQLQLPTLNFAAFQSMRQKKPSFFIDCPVLYTFFHNILLPTSIITQHLFILQ